MEDLGEAVDAPPRHGGSWSVPATPEPDPTLRRRKKSSPEASRDASSSSSGSADATAPPRVPTQPRRHLLPIRAHVDHVAAARFQKQRDALPIASRRKELVSTVRRNAATVVVGDTGSGKTTQLPQYLFHAGFAQPWKPPSGSSSPGKRRTMGGCIAVTQPRRVAAITVAQRVAAEMGTCVGGNGGLVGYSVRFDDRTGRSTRVKFATDGMLLREAQLDPSLLRYSCIVLDEAHERTVNTDILFGVIKRAMRVRNGTGGWKELAWTNRGRFPPLRVVVMSATLEVELFQSFFDAAVVRVPGRQFPVDVLYVDRPVLDWLDAAVTATLQAHEELTEAEQKHSALEDASTKRGVVLVFLPGQDEIEDARALLHQRSRAWGVARSTHFDQDGDEGEEDDDDEDDEGRPRPGRLPPLHVCPLYAQLPPERQLAAFASAPGGERKVILATNIAETSVTINGVRVVIDPGFIKMRSFMPTSGMDSLQVEPVSQAQARQRAGRAGREAPGQCLRLYPERCWDALRPSAIPEIRRVSLASVVLRLASMGLPPAEVARFPFLEPPGLPALHRALTDLLDLRALKASGDKGEDRDDTGGGAHGEGSLTRHGERLAALPLDPLPGHLLLTASEMGCGAEGAALVALLSVEGVFVTPRNKERESGRARRRFAAWEGDHLTLLNAFVGYKRTVRAAERDNAETRAAVPARQQGRKGRDSLSPSAWHIVQEWCRRHFLNLRSLRRADAIFRQLRDVCREMGTPLTSGGILHGVEKDVALDALVGADSVSPEDRVRRALVAGSCVNLAQRVAAVGQPSRSGSRGDVSSWGVMTKGHRKSTDKDAGRGARYRVVRTGQEASIHPSSTLLTGADSTLERRPEWVVFSDIVVTRRPYMRNVSRVDPAWLPELLPNMFQHAGGAT